MEIKGRAKRYECNLIEYLDLRKYKRDLIKREHEICQQCGNPLNQKGILDHIIPVGVGGSSVIWSKDNLQLICRDCNKKKTKIDNMIMREMRRNGYYYINNGIHIFLRQERECIDYYIKRYEEVEKIYI